MNHTLIKPETIAKLKEFDIDLMISTCGDNTFLRNKLETLKALLETICK